MGTLNEDQYLLIPILYCVNVALDFADGITARYYNQCKSICTVTEKQQLKVRLTCMVVRLQKIDFYCFVQLFNHYFTMF